MRVSIGTKNPVKIAATKRAFKKVFKDRKIKVESFNVRLKISNQPRSDKEAIKGAILRARFVLKKTEADFWVGLEGNVVDTKYGTFLSGWVAVVDKNGKVGLGSSGMILLPRKISKEIKKGKELGPLMDRLTGKEDTKRKQGAVGILTDNLVKREDAFERAVIYALARFINKKYFK